jgi:hypothetical protein
MPDLNIEFYYRILDLLPGASFDEVKTAYRDLVKVWHPDRFPHDPRLQRKAEEKLRELNAAYHREPTRTVAEVTIASHRLAFYMGVIGKESEHFTRELQTQVEVFVKSAL